MVPLLSFIADPLLSMLSTALLIYIILDLLISFNVINYSNQFVRAIHQAMASVFEPMLRPFRKLMPQGSAVDFSPIFLFIAIYFVQKVVIFGWLIPLFA